MVWAQSESDIQDALSNLPTEFQGKLNDTQIETIKNQSQQIFKEKCEKNGGLAAFETAQVCFIKSLFTSNLDEINKSLTIHTG